MDEAQQPSLGQEPAAKKKKTAKGKGDGAWAKKEANKTSNAAGTVSLKAAWQLGRGWLGNGGMSTNRWNASCAACDVTFDSKAGRRGRYRAE